MEGSVVDGAGSCATGLVEALSSGASFLEDVLDSMPEAIVITEKGRVLHANREFGRLFGYQAEECLGRELDELVMPEGRLFESEMLLHAVGAEGRGAVETVRKTSQGGLLDVAVLISRVRLREGVYGLFILYRDIRAQKLEQARMQHTAMHDGLTGLANRALFLDRVRLTMARLRRRPDRGFAVMFLDLDGFKKVNDTLGHAAGDDLLCIVAQRLTRSLRPQDTVARFGGDEFALLLDETNRPDEAMQVAERLQAEIGRTIETAGEHARVGASMGIAMATTGYAEAEGLLRHADSAMYAAKRAGKGRCVLFAGTAAA